MAFSVARIKELVVDFVHDEIVELEQFLGMHPNRKPEPVVEPAHDPAPYNPNADEIESLKGQLDAANGRVAELETELEATKASIAQQPAAPAPVIAPTADEAAAVAEQQPQGGTDGQAPQG